MTHYKVSLLQMNITSGDPEKNREKALSMIKQAISKKSKPDALLLPEMWTTAYQLGDIANICDQEGMPTNSLIAAQAKEGRVNIVAGSYASMKDRKVFNTAYVFNRHGDNIAKYQKIHLFKLMDEDKYIESGSQHCVFKLDGIKCGIIICYDLRFPELTRRLALEGIKLLFVPAQWPAARLDHWITLLKARAIENQIFIAAVNRAGENPEDEFAGGSMIISPWGEIIAQADYKEQVITADLDFSLIEQARSKIDILGDRVPHTY
ncbi:MAG TPA: carbon-nitrogen family hydrolase [Patescibacteria group bacterium]|nr:carbon-nitrogen family hydrolase [Patescibacteria group bacterium]